jgi:hypothetical protein
MTVGVVIKRLEEFRQGILQYGEMSESNQGLSHNGSIGMESSQSSALPDTLCQRFTFIDESVMYQSMRLSYSGQDESLHNGGIF